MANDNIISWNFANWLTIVIMAAIAFALFGIAQKYAQSKAGTGA